MYVIPFAGAMFALAYYGVLTPQATPRGDLMLFGGVWLGFTLLRMLALQLTRPKLALPVLPEESKTAATVGTIIDGVAGSLGLASVVGSSIDARRNRQRLETHQKAVEAAKAERRRRMRWRWAWATAEVVLAAGAVAGVAHYVGVDLWKY